MCMIEQVGNITGKCGCDEGGFSGPCVPGADGSIGFLGSRLILAPRIYSSYEILRATNTFAIRTETEPEGQERGEGGFHVFNRRRSVKRVCFCFCGALTSEKRGPLGESTGSRQKKGDQKLAKKTHS